MRKRILPSLGLRRVAAALASTFALAPIAAAHAGDQVDAVSELWARAAEVQVALADAMGSRASCAVDSDWQFDPSTAAGERLKSISITAQATRQQVLIAGLDSCQGNAPREVIRYVRITAP